MDTQIMIRIYFENGETRNTTVSHETFYGWLFNGDAREYLSRVLAPIPKNKYKSFEVFEVDENRNIVKSL